MNDAQKRKVLECLNGERHTIISTIGHDGEPQSATVGFAENKNLEIIFATWKWTRKYKNLLHDKRVSFVFGFESNVNVQYQGTANEIEKSDDLVLLYLVKKPGAKKYLSDEEYVFFKVTPTWLRYSDFGVEPKEILEFQF